MDSVSIFLKRRRRIDVPVSQILLAIRPNSRKESNEERSLQDSCLRGQETQAIDILIGECRWAIIDVALTLERAMKVYSNPNGFRSGKCPGFNARGLEKLESSLF
jgi:hypothetical protein